MARAFPSDVPTSKTESAPEHRVLNGWKEISEYMGRAIRTLERWEKELGLPVRRPRDRMRSPVIALPSDLDLWLQQGARRVTDAPDGPQRMRKQELAQNTKAVRAKLKTVRSRVTALQQQITRTVGLSKKLTARTRQRRSAS